QLLLKDFVAPESGIDDFVRFISEKYGRNVDRNRADLRAGERPHGKGFLFALLGADHRPFLTDGQRLSQAAPDDAMPDLLAGNMVIHDDILIIDDKLHLIAL